MMHITATNYLGESIALEPENGWILTNTDGLTPGTANINTSEMATNDGAQFSSARIPARTISLTLRFLPPIEDNRQKLYKYFPLKQKVSLRVKTDNRTVEIEGYTKTNDPALFTQNEQTQLQIVCPDPYFYSGGSSKTTFYGIQDLFEFETDIPEEGIEFSTIQKDVSQTVVYDGDIETGVTIDLYAIGNVGDITIYNIKTKETMTISMSKLETLTGSAMVYGDEIIITTTKGNKRITLIRNGESTNILNTLGANSKWFQLVKGDNVFTYAAASGQEYLQFSIRNKVVYEGV